MDHNHPKFIKFKKSQGDQANPILLKVFEAMSKGGQLDGLSDDAALEAVVTATEKIMNRFQ